MSEMSNHSYHYNRNLLASLPSFEPPLDLFDSLLQTGHDQSLPLFTSVNIDEIKEEPESDEADKKGSKDSKKKPRRKRRNLTGVSKQRRAANERERKRLQIINMAFKDLKGILPLFPDESNISKIEIVRLAARTIKHLSELANKDSDINSIDNSRSPGGSVTSDSSESGSSISNESTFPDFEHEAKMMAPEDIDISNLLSNYEELNSLDITQTHSFLQQQPPPQILEFKAEIKEEPTDFTQTSNISSCYQQPSAVSSSVASFTTYRQQKLSSSADSKQGASTTLLSSTSSTSSSSASPSTPDGFSGYDFNLFLDNSNDSDEVFPSMVSFW